MQRQIQDTNAFEVLRVKRALEEFGLQVELRSTEELLDLYRRLTAEDNEDLPDVRGA